MNEELETKLGDLLDNYGNAYYWEREGTDGDDETETLVSEYEIKSFIEQYFIPRDIAMINNANAFMDGANVKSGDLPMYTNQQVLEVIGDKKTIHDIPFRPAHLYTDISLMVAYKDGYNHAVKDALERLAATRD